MSAKQFPLWIERDGGRVCIGYLVKCSAGGWNAYVATPSGKYGSIHNFDSKAEAFDAIREYTDGR